jgi:hypothetical protein
MRSPGFPTIRSWPFSASPRLRGGFWFSDPARYRRLRAIPAILLAFCCSPRLRASAVDFGFPIPRDIGDYVRFRRSPLCSFVSFVVKSWVFRSRAISAITCDSGDSSGPWPFSASPRLRVEILPFRSRAMTAIPAMGALRAPQPSACVSQPRPPPPIALC